MLKTSYTNHDKISQISSWTFTSLDLYQFVPGRLDLHRFSTNGRTSSRSLFPTVPEGSIVCTETAGSGCSRRNSAAIGQSGEKLPPLPCSLLSSKSAERCGDNRTQSRTRLQDARFRYHTTTAARRSLKEHRDKAHPTPGLPAVSMSSSGPAGSTASCTQRADSTASIWEPTEG